MAKLKWRWSEYLPVSLQASILVFALVVVLSTISFSLLPENSWSDNLSSLLFLNVSHRNTGSHVTTPTINLTTNASELHGSGPSAQDLAPVELPHEIAVFVKEEESANSTTAANFSAPAIVGAGPDSLASAPNTSEKLGATNGTGAASAVPPPVAIQKPAPEPLLPVDGRERFIAPLLSFQVGAGNQLMEYISAAVVARALNRTLCLTPFFAGPSRHTGRVSGGLAWEGRYEVSSLSRFTRVSSMANCLRQCNYTLDANWLLKTSRQPWVREWKKYPLNNESWNLDWSYVKWQSTDDIATSLGSYNDRCVGLAGLFPGLRWRGAFLAVSAFMQAAPHIIAVTNVLQEYAIGKGTPYLAVHWRFEESECGSHQIGLCFVRCSDGAVIDSGLHPQAKEWHEAAQTQCNRDGHFRGVGIDKLDIIDAIQERAGNHSIKTVYLATDGWIRGPQSVALVKEVVHSLRKRGLTVIGLWKIPGLPNFADGKFFDPAVTFGRANSQMNGQQIALVEQELCARAAVFLGSGQSTWSLAVFRLRLARRRAEQVLRGGPQRERKAQDELVAETLLRDDHAAGLHCRYTRYMKRAAVNETAETYADEYPDGWLDLEACEGRIGRGGHCQVAKCF